MKLKWHMVLQALLFVSAAATALSTSASISAKWQHIAILVVSAVQWILAYFAHIYTPDGVKIGNGNISGVSKIIIFLTLGLLFITPAKAQTTTHPVATTTTTPTTTTTAQPTAFPETTVNFNLSPVTLPGTKTSVAGAETDIKIKITTNFALGETDLVGSSFTFVGGRGDYVIAPFSKWLNNISPTLNGFNFQLGITGSAGVVRLPSSTTVGTNVSHWGERAGFFLNYAANGNVGLGLEGQWCNFPGYAQTTYSLAFGPNFHF